MKDLRGRITRAVATAAVLTAIVVGLTPGVAAAASDTVAFVGDSVGRDAETAVRAIVEPEHRFAHYEAVAAGTVPYHYPRLLRAVGAPSGPDIVILELGTGDAFYGAYEARMERNARVLLRDISPHVDCIRWLDIKPGGTLAYPNVNRYAAGVNRAIHRVVEEFPKAEYMHYEAWTELAGNGYFLGDLLHHNAAGRTEMGRIVNQAVDSCDPSLTTGRFWDVRDDYWAAGDIAWMAASGVASGFPNDTYRAVIGGIEPKVTRAQMANYMWHLAGSPTGHPDHPWRDGAAWIDHALDWLADTGIANGYPDGTFRPDRVVSRGEIANFLWRLAGSPTGHPDHPWRDGPAWIDDALSWLAGTGIADGYPNGTFRPTVVLSRVAMAHLLHRYAVLPPAAPAAEPPVDTVAPPPADTSAPTTGPQGTTPPATAPGPPSSTTAPPSTPPTTAPATSAPPPTTIP